MTTQVDPISVVGVKCWSHLLSCQVIPDSGFREPMRKREWTFSKFADELRKRIAKNDSEAIYYQDALTDAVGEPIKHDFVHFNWQWLNERKKRYNWGQLTSNLLLIGQPGNITPCHFDEQHNFFNQVRSVTRKSIELLVCEGCPSYWCLSVIHALREIYRNTHKRPINNPSH